MSDKSVASFCCCNQTCPFISVQALILNQYFTVLPGGANNINNAERLPDAAKSDGTGWARKFLNKTVTVTGRKLTGWGTAQNTVLGYLDEGAARGQTDDKFGAGYFSLSFTGDGSNAGIGPQLSGPSYISGTYNASFSIDRLTGVVGISESFDAEGLDVSTIWFLHAYGGDQTDPAAGFLSSITGDGITVAGTAINYVGPSGPGTVSYTYAINVPPGQPPQYGTATISNIVGEFTGNVSMGAEYQHGAGPYPGTPGTMQGDIDNLLDEVNLTLAKQMVKDAIAARAASQTFTGPIDPSTGLPRNALDGGACVIQVTRRQTQGNPAWDSLGRNDGPGRGFYNGLIPNQRDQNNQLINPTLATWPDGWPADAVVIRCSDLLGTIYTAKASGSSPIFFSFNNPLAFPPLGTAAEASVGAGAQVECQAELALGWFSPLQINASKAWLIQTGNWLADVLVTNDHGGLTNSMSTVNVTTPYTLYPAPRLFFIGNTDWEQAQNFFIKQ